MSCVVVIWDGLEIFIGRSSWPVVKRIVRWKGASKEVDRFMVARVCAGGGQPTKEEYYAEWIIYSR